MKYILYLLFPIILLAACKGKASQGVVNGSAKTKIDSQQIYSLIKKFAPFINGMWVKKEYIDKVAQTQSPLAAADQALDLTVMYIDTRKTQGDTLLVASGWGNHDGSDMQLVFRPGKDPATIQFGNGELKYQIVKNDTLLLWKHTEENNSITTTYFIKSKQYKGTQIGEAMDFMVNKVLISGAYTMADTLDTKRTVIFYDDGKVKNFPSFSTYSINIDLNSDAMDNLDGIGFDYRTKHHTAFTYKFIQDTLNIYTTYPNADSTLLEIGELKYKLIKKH